MFAKWQNLIGTPIPSCCMVGNNNLSGKSTEELKPTRCTEEQHLYEPTEEIKPSRCSDHIWNVDFRDLRGECFGSVDLIDERSSVKREAPVTDLNLSATTFDLKIDLSTDSPKPGTRERSTDRRSKGSRNAKDRPPGVKEPGNSRSEKAPLLQDHSYVNDANANVANDSQDTSAKAAADAKVKNPKRRSRSMKSPSLPRHYK